jgi:hypothetical protein
MRRTLLIPLLALAAVAATFTAPVAMALDREALASGQLWRLWTGHLVHWNLSHLIWDGLTFGGLAWLLDRLAPRGAGSTARSRNTRHLPVCARRRTLDPSLRRSLRTRRGALGRGVPGRRPPPSGRSDHPRPRLARPRRRPPQGRVRGHHGIHGLRRRHLRPRPVRPSLRRRPGMARHRTPPPRAGVQYSKCSAAPRSVPVTDTGNRHRDRTP